MMRLKHWGAVLMGCAALLLMACTVVDLDENGKPVLPADPNAKPSFDHLTPQQIAQQTWQSRVIDAANQHALDATALEKVRQASGATPQSVFVRLSSEVTGIDVSNPREQKLTLTLHGQPLVVQLGPVMRGNAIRDASGFKFEDFTNQVQFAQLSRAYNREATVDASWAGKPVDILFAATVVNGSLQDAAALALKQEAR